MKRLLQFRASEFSSFESAYCSCWELLWNDAWHVLLMESRTPWLDLSCRKLAKPSSAARDADCNRPVAGG